jgi:BCD family chlorophyll transporter-like MFS transporter
MSARPLGWLGIVRLGLVQTALGAIVVLTTSTMNRVMVVELALPAMVPGLLVGLHYAVQLLRPRLGHGSDIGGRRTPWIIGGMAVLALGGVCAAVATTWMGSDRVAGFAFGLLAFTLIGLGVGAAGTSLLVLLAKRVAAERRAAAATIVWIMMIAGFAITATTAGHLLDPFSSARLIAVTGGVGIAAFLLTLVAVRNVEGPMGHPGEHAVDRALAGTAAAGTIPRPAFRAALAQVWAEPQARRFTVFVFVSMLAYSLQDLILEPFAGTVFGLTPGESTKLAGVQHGGVLLGMVVVAVAGSAWAGSRAGALRTWMVGGCIASALALLALAIAGFAGHGWPLRATVFALGLANGAFAVAAIGTMMALAGSGGPAREGIRMGMWGAAQAVAFGLGGFLGTVASDLARQLLGSPLLAYAAVFTCEGLLFLVSATLAMRVGQVRATNWRPQRSARRGELFVGIERG